MGGIILITLVHLRSFKAIEDAQDSWTKYLRRNEVGSGQSRPGPRHEIDTRSGRSRFRSRPRRRLTTVSNGDHHTEYAQPRTNYFTSTSSPMSLADALKLLEENHDA